MKIITIRCPVTNIYPRKHAYSYDGTHTYTYLYACNNNQPKKDMYWSESRKGYMGKFRDRKGEMLQSNFKTKIQI